jgi:hypothetical protein
MNKEEKINNLKRLQDMINALDNNQMSVEDIPEEDIDSIAMLYDLDIKKLKLEIEEKDKQLEEIKKQMQHAINYLKKDNNKE